MIFLDSSLIVAYLNDVDENHAKALKIIRDIDRDRYGTSVITDYIFDEVATVMLVRIKRIEKVVEAGDALLGTNLMLRINEHLFSSAWKIFKEQKKPALSFTDCTSIAVCRANGISTIATFDEDFKKFNFNVIGL